MTNKLNQPSAGSEEKKPSEGRLSYDHMGNTGYIFLESSRGPIIFAEIRGYGAGLPQDANAQRICDLWNAGGEAGEAQTFENVCKYCGKEIYFQSREVQYLTRFGSSHFCLDSPQNHRHRPSAPTPLQPIGEGELPPSNPTAEDLEVGMILVSRTPGCSTRTPGECNLATRLAERERQLKEAPRPAAGKAVFDVTCGTCVGEKIVRYARLFRSPLVKKCPDCKGLGRVPLHPPIVLRWGHKENLMNFMMGLEVHGVEVARTYGLRGDVWDLGKDDIRRKAKKLAEAMGVSSTVPELDKWEAR